MRCDGGGDGSVGSRGRAKMTNLGIDFSLFCVSETSIGEVEGSRDAQQRIDRPNLPSNKGLCSGMACDG